jgi:cytochrome c nitrite reductase small subunit
MTQTSSRGLKFFILAVLLALGGGLFLMLGPPQLLAKTESPEFCASCHVMEAQYEAWFHQGAHRRKACVECHLPHGNLAEYYTWKSIDGMKDVVVFNSGRVPERIVISQHGEKVLQGNCVRCHESAVEMINQERNCWSCHRRLSHTRSGAIETR